MDASHEFAPPESRRLKIARGLHGTARWILWLIAAGTLGVTPWLLGGNSSAGYYWTLWLGRLSLLPLVLWLVACALRNKNPGAAFWVPVICWGLLAAQVITSTYNRSSAPVAPWLGEGFDAIPHNPGRPSTAFKQATVLEGWFWLSLGLLALTARNVGLSGKQIRSLLWILAGTTMVLAIIGIPFKFSGQMLILGKWTAPEWYFYSTFLYHNHWCAFTLFGISAVAALFENSKNIALRCSLAVAGVVIAASAPLSTSRLGTLVIGAFGLVVIFVIIRHRRKPTLSRHQPFPVLAVSTLLGTLAICSVVFYFYKVHGAPGGHRTWSGILKSNPFGIRQTLAEDTIPMVQAKPWFGWGLGGYGGAFRFYQRAETRVVHNQGRITLYDHPHNDWLERLAELGFVGFGLFLFPGFWWVMLAQRTPASNLHRWLLVGCVGVLFFALGDMVFVNRAVAACFALFFPLALGPAASPHEE
ncbi:MAG: O-antigen ligase family protein [Opitutaceae bacterium]